MDFVRDFIGKQHNSTGITPHFSELIVKRSGGGSLAEVQQPPALNNPSFPRSETHRDRMHSHRGIFCVLKQSTPLQKQQQHETTRGWLHFISIIRESVCSSQGTTAAFLIYKRFGIGVCASSNGYLLLLLPSPS